MSFSSCDTVNSGEDKWYPQHCLLKKYPGEPENNWIYDQPVFSTLLLVSPIASRTRTSFSHCLLMQTPSEPSEALMYLSFMSTLSME